MSQVDDIMERVLTLSPEERLELRIHLIDAEHGPEESGVEQAWAEEIARRIEAYRRGEVELVSATDALDDARELLAKMRG